MSEAAPEAAGASLAQRGGVHLLDRAYAAWVSRRKMFTGGLGDERLLALLEGGPVYRPQTALVAPKFEAPYEKLGMIARDGTFPSPVEHLPEASQTVHVRHLTASGRRGGRPARGSVVLLAGSRDAGYRMRTGLFGALVPAGVDLYLLENPLYGLRRPPGQDGENLATVAGQGLLMWGMVEEARALLGWLRREQLGPLCVAGYSMGGYAAAAVGSLVDHTVGVAALAAGLSPAPVYTERLLSKQVDWERLARDLGGTAQARARVARFFDSGSTGRLPPPRTPQAAVLVAMSSDGYVPAEETRALHARYPGSRLHWLAGGHVSGVLFQRAALRAAVGEALERARLFSEPPEVPRPRPVSGP
jgi:Alpha/beta hydrolase domain containing 18